MTAELRLNPLTGEWVIIAPQRAYRPSDFRRAEPKPALPAHSPGCPFCAGNEHMSDEIARFPAGEGQPWQTRVVRNKYPAVAHTDGRPGSRSAGLRFAVDAVGSHEVIIESPRHDVSPALQSLDELTAVLGTYRARYNTLRADPRIAHVVVFRNHGQSAGMSLLHPHSQLLGIPVVSSQVRGRLHLFEGHLQRRGDCLECDLIEEEVGDGARLLHASEHFVAVIPFAALSAFHTWILPRRHVAHFGDATDAELSDLAGTLGRVLRMLHVGLDDPDYNYVIRSSPVRSSKPFHWYLSIVPRVGRAAGFELGSGMYINATVPEESAAFLREVDEAS